jgi:signal transduction histidine kinase/DNA-binding LacI/PurR family transcriptional regulator
VNIIMSCAVNDLNGKKRRLTIGFLDENGNDEYHGYLTEGIFKAAEKYGVNVVRFGHFATNDTYKHEPQIKTVLQYVKQFKLDGLLFLGWARAVSFENYDNFRRLFKDLPLFSIGTGYKDIPHVYFDGDNYIKDLLMHLIKVHRFKNVAYIAPFWPDNRNEIYRSIMKQEGIFNPSLYISEKELTNIEVPVRGQRAVSILLDERKVKVDAIVSLYNAETEGVINELRSRGLSVPKDIAVTSYEDGEVGKFFSPSFTTVQFPWKELGFVGCERFIELLTKGNIPLATEVPGKLIIRNSCGCMNQDVDLAGNCVIGSTGINLYEMDDAELEVLERSITAEHCNHLNLNTLFRAFYKDIINKSRVNFIKELQEQLRDVPPEDDFSGVKNIVSQLRNILMPYISLETPDMVFLAEDIFQQGQVLLRERVINAWGNKELVSKRIYHNLEKVSQGLIQNTNLKSLSDALDANIYMLNIPSCYVFIFENSGNTQESFEKCRLIYECTNYNRLQKKLSKSGSASEMLQEILLSEDRLYLMMANLLHIGDDFIGFVLYEPGSTDERVYQALSIHISTALSNANIFKKLDGSYKMLVENAHREGMANIATGILHNISNVLNSINTSIYSVKDIIKSSPIDEFIKANGLLEAKLDSIEEFILHDEKGSKLMQFYTKLSEPLSTFQHELSSNIKRMDEKATLINELLIAQKSYEVSGTMTEQYSLRELVEDAVKMNHVSLEKQGIKVVVNCDEDLKVMLQRTKLLHILMNIIKNAVEAMAATPQESRILTLSINKVEKLIYLRISDTGCGIPQNKLKNIFNYGFTTKREGHGYGLHSCANYMTEMGGKMWAESDGTGATFVLQFQG